MMVVFKLDSDETAQILARGPSEGQEEVEKKGGRQRRRKETDEKYNEEERDEKNKNENSSGHIAQFYHIHYIIFFLH